MNYETSKAIHQISRPEEYIYDVAISADSHIIAFRNNDGVSRLFLFNVHIEYLISHVCFTI